MRIAIRKVNLGFIVVVRCQTFVFENEKKMFDAIKEYFDDPEKAEKKYVTMKPCNEMATALEKMVGAAFPVTEDIVVGTPRVSR